MQVKLYKPQNILLKQYIECFYTLQRHPEDESVTYTAFPSIFSMVCLNAATNIEILGNNLTFKYCLQNKLETRLVCNFGHSGRIRYEGAANEMVIYFKPLGLNAFLEKDLKNYMGISFVKFDPFDDYQSAMTKIFSIDDDEAKIAALEDYWLSKYIGFKHPFLHQVVDEITASGGSSSLSETALKHRVSRTTLNKHFDLHIGTTPSQFRKIVRFRNAMKRHRQKISAENLTDISYDADYFDQSHMVKDFKTLTRHSPKDFFSKLSSLEDGNINWLFL